MNSINIDTVQEMLDHSSLGVTEAYVQELGSDVNIDTVQEMLGHSSLEVTEAYVQELSSD